MYDSFNFQIKKTTQGQTHLLGIYLKGILMSLQEYLHKDSVSGII